MGRTSPRTPEGVRTLRAQMSLVEKASLTSGANFWNTKPVPRLGIPAIMLTDGPHGLRKQGGAADHLGLNESIPATCFPTAATLANSWDAELLTRVGEALGAEAAAENVRVLLGPGLNIKRNPLAGRNFEYFSEDPLVSGVLAAAMIRGIQSRGVAACAKHFAVNSQETYRMIMDEIVDERALHELYLEGFRIAITQGRPWTVMSSYNKVNGVYANENAPLLQSILRERWGFDGLVVTDWGGNNDRVAGLRAGNALEMPSTDGVTDREVVHAVENGSLDEAILDERVDELLTLIDRTSAPTVHEVDVDAHHELAVEAARRSIVLATNRNDILPLSRASGRIAVIGDFAARPRYQGAGSSLVNPRRLDATLDALRDSELDIVGYEPGFRRQGGRSRRRHARALALAARADCALLFLGLDESAEAESLDRRHMRLAENQLMLAQDLIAQGTPIVVIVAGGAPVELPFADDVDALVLAYLGGQGGGTALADVITGRANPAGKLAETYPLSYADVPSATIFARAEATAEHRESIYLGYRYYDKVGALVRFPFGHGLSFTSFAYSDLSADARGAQLTVTNTGERSGREVVQLYLEAPDAAQGQIRVPRELAGFATVLLEPGQSARVEIAYAEHAFSFFDTAAGQWRTIPGRYGVLAAASSRDIRLRMELDVAADPVALPDPGPLPHYATGRVAEVPAEEFERLLGRDLPASDWPRDRPLTRADIIAQTKGRGGFASLLHGTLVLARAVLMALGRPHDAANTYFVRDLPFRSIARMSGGTVDDDMLDGLLLMVNGRFWRGLRAFLSARRALRRSKRVQKVS